MITIHISDGRALRIGVFVGRVDGDTFAAKDVLKRAGLVWQPARTWHDDPAKRVGYWYSHIDKPLVSPEYLFAQLEAAGIRYRAVNDQ